MREPKSRLLFLAATPDASSVRFCSKFELLKLAILLAAISLAASAQAEQRGLRVCADPNNLPFSNRRGEVLKPASPISSAESLAQRLIIPGGRNAADLCAIPSAKVCAI
jgi:hypothetical protein